MVYRTELKFNTIYVLEALPPGDRRTGQELYDAVIGPAASGTNGLFAEYHAIPTAARLTAVLTMILDDCRRYRRGPIVHIEAHGDEGGLQMADGEYVPWVQLTPQLAAINEACRMNLLVVAVMCHGWSLTLSLMPSDRAPVFMLIGPPDTMTAGALEAATKRFYEALVSKLDLNEGLEAMNSHMPFEGWSIRPATAEILFCRVFRYYVQDMTTGDDLAQRENTLVADIVRFRKLDVIQSAAIRQEIRAHLANYRWWYNHLRHTFLMLDLFPENATRFGLSYDKCIHTAA